MSQLDDISYIDTLQLQASSGESALTVYANGRHQAVILVTVKAVTKDNKPMKSVDKLIEGLFLCFADDGKKLNWKGDKGWTYTNEQGEYNGDMPGATPGVSSTSVANDGTVIFKWFVSTTDVETRRISAGIRTSTNFFSTADNSYGAEKSSVRIEARPAINYSHRINIDIHLGPFVTMSKNLFWHYGEKQGRNGTIRRRIVYIYPNSKTGLTKFKEHSVKYTGINDGDLHSSFPYDGEGFLNLSWEGRSLPCSVMRRSQNNEYFRISLWYSRQNDVDMDGSVRVENSDSIFKLELHMEPDKHFGVDEHGIPTLLLYQFSFPVGEKTTHYRWENAMRPATVKLLDFYGNEGSLQLVFNDDANFEAPGIL